MRSTSRMKCEGGILRGFAGVAVLVAGAAAGCSEAGPGVNCFKDDGIPENLWTTPSAEAIAAAKPEPLVRQRGWEPSQARLEPEGSPHFPLWWEDPFEDKGSLDGRYAWTYEDYIALPYSNARWLLNTMLWPASAIVTPPGTTMISDGVLSRQLLGYDHDAVPGKSWAVSGDPAGVTATTQPAP